MSANSETVGQVIDDIESGGGKIVRGFHEVAELRKEINEAVAAGRAVVFAPTTRSLRHFYNTAGFVSTLTSLAAELGDVEVLVPPGLYGQRHLFAVGPKRYQQNCRQHNSRQ